MLEDYLPTLIPVAIFAGAIVGLRVFFTLWGPIDRHLNGTRLDLVKSISVKDVKEKLVTIHLKSGGTIESVLLAGTCSPFDYPSYVVATREDGKKVFIRSDEIKYFEE